MMYIYEMLLNDHDIGVVGGVFSQVGLAQGCPTQISSVSISEISVEFDLFICSDIPKVIKALRFEKSSLFCRQILCKCFYLFKIQAKTFLEF